jgi:hypothetical protein
MLLSYEKVSVSSSVQTPVDDGMAFQTLRDFIKVQDPKNMDNRTNIA